MAKRQLNYSRITLSGPICTGKSTLFKDLTQRLGWQSYSTGQFFRDYAAKHHLVLESASEQGDQITRQIDSQARELLKSKQHIIVEGWMAGITSQGLSGVLRVLLLCQDQIRFKRFAKREKVSLSEAEARVRARDTNWLAEIGRIYNRQDIFDPRHYSLIINTTNLNPQQTEQLVLNKLGWSNNTKES